MTNDDAEVDYTPSISLELWLQLLCVEYGGEETKMAFSKISVDSGQLRTSLPTPRLLYTETVLRNSTEFSGEKQLNSVNFISKGTKTSQRIQPNFRLNYSESDNIRVCLEWPGNTI